MATAISIPKMAVKTVELELVGDSPLISHRWAQKAKQQMLDKQMKKASKGKDAKDPEKDYQESIYYTDDEKPAFPAVAFKAAAVGACRYVDMKMTEARGAFHVMGELVELDGKPEMREDIVRIGNGVADIRYRAQFPKWKARIQVRYNENAISAEQIVKLFEIAGFACGIGEWRPQRNGSYGMFHVAGQEEIDD